MGGAQIANSNPLYINAYNPATYAILKLPTFNVDLNHDRLTMESNVSSIQTNNTYLGDASFGFPIGKRAGMAFSLGQFTKIGYDITANQQNANVGSVNYIYQGEGGINQFIFGGGFAPILKDNTALLVGVSGAYYFGFARTRRSVGDFVDEADHLNSAIVNKVNVNDLGLDIGLLFKQRVGENKISVGATFSPSIEMKATNQRFVYTYTVASEVERIKDTVEFSNPGGSVTTPSFLGIGLGFELGKSLTLNADLKIQDWSELQLFGTNAGLNTRQELSFGFEYLPNSNALAKYFQAIRYRAGVRTANTRLNINGENLNEVAGSFGLGLPVLKAKSASTLNIGMEFGNRGSGANNLIKENFTHVFIGVSFNPHKFDAWFKRRKYE